MSQKNKTANDVTAEDEDTKTTCAICALCSIHSQQCPEKNGSTVNGNSKLGDSINDPEKRRNFLDYTHTVEEVASQDKKVENIVTQIIQISSQENYTDQDVQRIKQLREFMQTEYGKLDKLITRAHELRVLCDNVKRDINGASAGEFLRLRNASNAFIWK